MNKHQAPNLEQIPMTNVEMTDSSHAFIGHWCLVIGACLMLGA
jgi:hypothetical protein